MTKKKINQLAIGGVGLLLLTLGIGSGVKAATIDFEDPGVAQPSGSLTSAGNMVTSRGFKFTSPLNTGFDDELQLAHNTGFTGDGANNTTNLGIEDGATNDQANNIVTLMEATGKLFSLQSLDIAEFSGTEDYARTVKVIGNISGGGMVMKTITLDGIVDGPGGQADFQTETFDNTWMNLLSVTFQGSGSPGLPDFGDTAGKDAFLLDNLLVTVPQEPPEPPTTTPEPSMLLGVISLGLGGLGGLLRRKRSQ